MGNKLKELESSNEGPFVHTAPKQARDSIAAHGLRPSKPGYDEHKGVYVLPHPGEEVSKNWAENATQYGTDIYEVKKNPNTKVFLDIQDGALGSFFHKTIKHSDFNRTGHIFHNDEGHPQVHWHKEEECPEGRTANTSTHLSEQEFLSRHSDGL